MCEQCLGNPLYFGEVLPEIQLIRARRDGNEMKAGDWGLLYGDNPFFVWSGTRETKNPDFSVIDSDISDDFREMCLTPDAGYDIYLKAMRAGFDPGQHKFVFWLWEYIFDYVEKTNPEIDDDPMPHLDNFNFHDYGILKGPYVRIKQSQ